jgi:hypothetical protein
MGYQHPQLRNRIFPESVDILTTALRMARDEDPARRDLRPLFAILAALPKADPDVIGDMQTRKNSITGFPWEVAAQPAPGETSPADIEMQRASDIGRRFRRSGMHNTAGIMLNGLFFGRSLVETPWGMNEAGENCIIGWNPVDVVDVRPDPAAVTGLSRMIYPVPNDDRYTIQRYDVPEQIMVARYNPMEGIDNCHEGGLFHSILWYSYLKFLNWYGWARAGERFGVITYPRGYSDQKSLNNAYNFMQQLADHAAVMPEELKALIKELMGNPPDYQMFEKFIDKVSSKSQRLILGQDVVNTAHSTGTHAQSQDAAKTTADYNWSDIIWLQDIYTDQYVIRDYNFNYGAPPNGVYPRFRYVTDESVDYAANARTLSQTVSAGYEPVDDDEVSRMVGFKVKRTAGPPPTTIPGA